MHVYNFHLFPLLFPLGNGLYVHYNKLSSTSTIQCLLGTLDFGSSLFASDKDMKQYQYIVHYCDVSSTCT